MMSKKMFIPMCLLLATLFVWGIAEGHGRHLSDIGYQTNVTMTPCPDLAGYVVSSDQYECYIIYDYVGLDHSGLHVQAVTLNENGDCVCPTTEEKN